MSKVYMPLPCVSKHGAKLCECLSKRTKLPCNNVAAFGSKACRMHGAHKTHARLSGSHHPNFKHGLETISAKKDRSKKIHELNEAMKLLKKFIN